MLLLFRQATDTVDDFGPYEYCVIFIFFFPTFADALIAFFHRSQGTYRQM